jgi:ribonuclease III
MPGIDDETLEECEDRLGYIFRDPDLLIEALTHGSAKSSRRPSNERLEFLGDSLLGFVVGDWLFDHAEEIDEGIMTRARAQVVSRAGLLRVGHALDVERFLIVGASFEHRRLSDSQVANAVEAIIAAIYLDGGLRPARRFVMRHFHEALRHSVEKPRAGDFKSRLGELVQKKFGAPPRYQTVGVSGPDHDQRFDVVVIIDGEEMGQARARSKQEAQRRAARVALEQLGRGRHARTSQDETARRTTDDGGRRGR